MKRSTVVLGSIAACACLGLVGILEVAAAPQNQRSNNRNRLNTTATQRPVAQAATSGDEGGVAGGIPDVTASRIGLNSTGNGDDFFYYGSAVVGSDTIRAFSIASTSCNLGDATAEWIPGGRNPVIAQNLYRLHDGKFEQVAMSWLKHSFCAVSEPTCTNSCQSTGCSTLGIGCADTYWATLNGDNNDMGPRWHINPQGLGANQVHNDVYNNPVGPNTIRGRLQVKDADIIEGAEYFAEIQYVTHDEPYPQRYNNASYRRVNLTNTSMSGKFVGQASVIRGEPALNGWRALDPNVLITHVIDDSPSGRFNLGTRVYDNGDGTWTYEYALHNLNSRRAAGGFSIPIPAGVNVTNIGFHDVDYHSGDGVNYVTQDGTDWASNIVNNRLEWKTTPHSINVNANALRWGTIYNFRFTADTAPQSVNGGIDLFVPATGNEPIRLTINTLGPEEPELICVGDIVGTTLTPPGDGIIDGSDLAYLIGEWGDNPGSIADIVDTSTLVPPPDGIVDGADLAYLIGNWGVCD